MAPATPKPGPEQSVRTIVARWRALTGGSATRDPNRPTLVALSGGSDSSALLIALSTAQNARLVAAHVRHDLRSPVCAERDAHSARALAERLAIEFVEGTVQVPRDENAEGAARKKRYELLTQIANGTGCKFVATAHHAEDQLETMLMTMLRGSGLAGLSGIASSRPLTNDITLIRPALALTRDELVSIREDAGWESVHDETNDDRSRLRARLRHSVVPELLEAANPGLPDRLNSLSSLLDQANDIVRARATEIALKAEHDSQRLTLPVKALENEPPIIVGEVLRKLASRLTGETGADSRTHKHLAPVITRITSKGEHAKIFELAGLHIEVTNKAVTLSTV